MASEVPEVWMRRVVRVAEAASAVVWFRVKSVAPVEVTELEA